MLAPATHPGLLGKCWVTPTAPQYLTSQWEEDLAPSTVRATMWKSSDRIQVTKSEHTCSLPRGGGLGLSTSRERAVSVLPREKERAGDPLGTLLSRGVRGGPS